MPPRSPLAPAGDRPRANRIFVDREAPFGVFTRAALDLPADGLRLLVFYGVGGQGKTALCRELVRLCGEDPSLSHLRIGHVDLHGREKRLGAYATLWLRNALAKGGRIGFAAYDIAFANYWREAFPEQPLPNMEGKWLDRALDLGVKEGAENLSGPLKEQVAELVQDLGSGLFESIPFVGLALKRLGGFAVRKARSAWDHAVNDALKHLYREGEMIPAYEIGRLLPFFLARDIERHRRRNPGDRIAVFIDEYEGVFGEGSASSKLKDNPFDEAVRLTVQECQTAGALFVFFSRERLPWPEIDPAWTADLAGAQHLLHGLAPKDAETFLAAVPVEEPAIRAAMIQGASARDPKSGAVSVYPIMLDLQVDHYMAVKLGTCQAPDPGDFRIADEDFAARRNELIRRFLRNYDDALDRTLRRLAVARWFDRGVFEHLVRIFSTGFPLDRIADILDLSFVQEVEGEPGRHAMHSLIGEGLRTFLSADDLRSTREALADLHWRRAAVEREADLTPRHFDEAGEAVFHRGHDDVPRLASEWIAYAGAIENIRFGPAMERISRQILDRVAEGPGIAEDRYAGLLLQLAEGLFGQGRYRDAEPLHRRALEIRERVLGPEHPDTATSLSKLARSLDDQGRHQDAEPLHRRALGIRERVLGPEHLDTAVSLDNLAVSLRYQGRYQDSEPLQCRALEIRERMLGPEHPDTAINLNNVAESLDGQDDRDRSLFLVHVVADAGCRSKKPRKRDA
jgi:tetratricopeptide (TPR) repeat protein